MNLCLLVWAIAFGFQYPWMLLGVTLAVAYVVFKRKYYWMHEEYLASPGKSGEDGSERCRIIEGPYPLANYFVYL